MKILKTAYFAILLPSIFSLISCAALMRIKSNTNSQLGSELKNAIFIDNNTIKTVVDENFRYLLFQKMKQNGFQISEIPRSLALVFELSDIIISECGLPDESMKISSFPEHQVNYFGLKYCDCSVPSYSAKHIYVKIEQRSSHSERAGVPLWDATIVVEQDTYEKYYEQVVEVIALNIGKNIQRKINLKNFK